ncbi:CueP family metal-binding protein [Georgenia sp. H159]|uniref:CueP family metal-binding protein n=1 Tax=Georgenia sp. H159 TaxID=3076115 RepID=UPI002D771CB6|nr:CueP family metal-binding protein [Georgenia sp. H159]
MPRNRTAAAAAAALLLSLTACSATDAPGDASAPAADAPLLAAYDLDGLSGKEIVDHLDRLGGADRPADLMASVRAEELVVTDGSEELAVELPEEEFYVSFAPYVDSTHECYYHSLTTCQGELVEQDIDVTLTSSDGDVLVDETTTTYANGFAGYWLPRGFEGTLEVSYDGYTGEVPIATGPEDPTCITTLQLT